MTTTKFVEKYNDYLVELADVGRAVKEKQYLYSELEHFGVAMGKLDNFLKSYKKWLMDLGKDDLIQLVKEMWGHEIFEYRMMALKVLVLRKELLESDDLPLIEKLMRESGGWALLDSLIIPVMPVLLEKDEGVYRVLDRWIADNDFWVRRSALLAQLLFFRKDKGGDRDLFLRLAKSQFDERWIDEIYTDKLMNKRAKFFIRKAIGWTLREMSARQPQVVFDFLRVNKDIMSGLSYREGSRRLPESLKKQLLMPA